MVRELLDAAFLRGDSSLLNIIALGLMGLFAVQAFTREEWEEERFAAEVLSVRDEGLKRAGAITSLAGFWGNLQEAAGAAERIFELMERPPEPPGARSAGPSHQAGKGGDRLRRGYLPIRL